MTLITEVLSEVTTRTGTVREVLVYDDVTLEVKSLTIEGKDDTRTRCEVLLRNKDGTERERKAVEGTDALLDVTGLTMKRARIRGKIRIAPDFPRPEFSTATLAQDGRVIRTGP